METGGIGKKAKILLLNPPGAAVSTGVILNLAYLAASLRTHGHEVMIIDATAPFKTYTAGQVKEVIQNFQPDFIGVTLTITFIPQVYLFLKDLRSLGIPVIAGGPHPNSLPEEVIENGADIAAIGEGEQTIVELAEHFAGNGLPLPDITGLCFKDGNGKFFYTPPRSLINDIDRIPFPDFADFPIKNYTGSDDVNSNPLFWSVLTSRGCPFDCIFCSSHNVFGRSIRMRSARNVFEEIQNLVRRFGAQKITFQDDEILCSKERFLELCGLVISSGMQIKMSIRTRIDSIDDNILLKARKAGITRMTFGIESFNDRTLQNINKKYTVKIIQEKFKAIAETKFPFVSFTIICGFHWETKEELWVTLREVAKIPFRIPYFIGTGTPIPYPKTRLYEMYHRQFRFTDWWLDSRNHAKSTHGYQPFFMDFASAITSLYERDTYWNYTSRMHKDIRSFSWKLFQMFMRRHLSLGVYLVVIILSKTSFILWGMTPALEKKIFGMRVFNRIRMFRNEIVFTTKY